MRHGASARQRRARQRKCIMKCEEFEAIGLERSGLRMGELDAAFLGAAPARSGTDTSEEVTLVADSEAGDFTLLPGSLPQDVDDSAIVRVGMQRGALSALGLPVDEERVSDWIQVDLLVGQDGLPKAVRLPQSQ